MALDLWVLVVSSIILSLIGILIQKRMVDTSLVSSIKADMKKLEKDAKSAKSDVKKLTKITSRQLELQKQLLGHVMKPTMISSIPILFCLMFFNQLFEGLVLTLPFSLPLIGSTLGWLGVYIAVSLVSTLAFKKIFGLDF
jgi:uncharacterized membrane protein (DUF106 family)